MALNLLMQYVVEEDIALCIISEPPRIKNPNSQWLFSTDGLAGIFYRPEVCGRLLVPVTTSDGICMANRSMLSLIACYISPNTYRTSMLEYLDDLSDSLALTDNPTLIAGDLNSRSPLWSSSIYN